MTDLRFIEDTTGRIAVNPKFVKVLFDYNAETGQLIWKERECCWFPDVRACRIFNAKFPGKVTGCDDRKGYLHVRMLGKLYFVHRLVWAWHYGEWPTAGYDLDHIDRDGFNNRIDNLRLATRSQNCVNSHKPRGNNKEKGYTYVKDYGKLGKYLAQASWEGKKHNLGVFDSKEEAINAYDKFAKENHGEFYPGERE